MKEKEAVCSLIYGENRLEFSDFKVDPSAMNSGNPENASFLVSVFSHGFSGWGEFDCDIRDVWKTVSELRQ